MCFIHLDPSLGATIDVNACPKHNIKAFVSTANLPARKQFMSTSVLVQTTKGNTRFATSTLPLGALIYVNGRPNHNIKT